MEKMSETFLFPGYRQSKRRIIVAALVFAALTTPSFLLFPDGSTPSLLFDFISIVGFGVLTLGWCYYDGLERGVTIGAGFRLLIVLFGVLALFIYLIKSRGLGRGLISIGFALLFILCLGLAGGISSFIVGLIVGFD